MKIGILTLPLHTNYGGILQAYALFTVLQNMGHSVTLIDDKLYTIETWKERLSLIRWNAMKRIGLKSTCHPQIEQQNEMKFILPFISKHLPNQISVSKVRPNLFDAIVVGSDQVWRGAYSTNLFRYFLDFTKGWSVKRYAYAASFGVDNWSQDESVLMACKRLIKNFDYISVREKSGIEVCSKMLEIKADWVIDPTMLLTKENYLSICTHQMTSPACTSLATYVLDRSEKTQKMINLIAEQEGLPVIDMQSSIDGRYKRPIEHWLKSIAQSEYVFTDSFHGTVFAILFNKPFIVCGNKERGQPRFETLLSMTGLTDRMISSIEDIPIVLSRNIDWQKVNAKVDKERMRCLNILNQLTNIK